MIRPLRRLLLGAGSIAWLLPVAMIAGLVLIAFGWHYHKPPGINHPSGKITTYSSNKPSEVKPNPKTYIWQGGADEPKFIDLPSIGTNGYIVKVGIDQNHDMASPDNIFTAGWFVQGARPGANGLSIIDGHVGFHKDGIFFNLRKLKSDDRFSLTLGSGKVLHYRVLAVRNINNAQVADQLFSQSPKVASQLNLITCGGDYNYQTHEFEQRTIVTSELLAT